MSPLSAIQKEPTNQRQMLVSSSHPQPSLIIFQALDSSFSETTVPYGKFGVTGSPQNANPERALEAIKPRPHLEMRKLILREGK